MIPKKIDRNLRATIVIDMIHKAQDTGYIEDLYDAFEIPYEKTNDESLTLFFEGWLLLNMQEIFEEDPKDFDRRIQLSGI